MYNKKYTSVIKSIAIFVCFGITIIARGQDKNSDRQLWLQYMDKIARPVIMNLAEDNLKQNMPGVMSPHIDNAKVRSKVAYLEAFGRTFSGIAPWINLEGGSEQEISLRNQYREWTLKAIANAVNPSSKDYMTWEGGQPLVDASFLALGLVRCPWVWHHLDSSVQKRVVTAFISTRYTVPAYSNWLLFSAMIETFFCAYDLPYDAVRIDYAIREFSEHWYVGDGMFSDGMQFHLDYYNSYVIQPYLQVVLETISKKKNSYNYFILKFDKIRKRYAEIQERMINTDGSFPVTGRSIVYRSGAFHHLADMALRKGLPASLNPAQVRSALTSVIKKTLGAPETFDQKGWLNIGLNGHQPDIADVYITTGSLYLCSEIFLPLGLTASDSFWSDPEMPWTAVKAWNGQDLSPDHALDLTR
ncbi:DUF2264 domain-containing protein [Ginsengibacter hankyongi]|uniref:DUF2264 domain-containing protein n=1 Tax=Ginsengibacter hankyongi TaxID=2607284 RepID=A0A5J5IF79_9BACT|nr:DUF2264 domain-containing protein [Ginsengibacter hankyongi]KAA9038512.1 DUF2264 domain-containing protein [Ginsengibacter hankyongi]